MKSTVDMRLVIKFAFEKYRVRKYLDFVWECKHVGKFLSETVERTSDVIDCKNVLNLILTIFEFPATR